MKRKLLKVLLSWLSLIILNSTDCVSQQLKGIIKDKNTSERLIGATINIKSTKIGASTDMDGNFILDYNGPFPITLVASYVGYLNKETILTSPSKTIEISLSSNETILKEVSVVDSRLTEKQRESAVTVESMDIIAIKQTPAANFYEGLGSLKGVDLTSASIGFKVINTRGFNSTSPVRSLQVIDGVDNQAPGLNFSLGNFLGSSELDVLKVDLVVGASSAFYGPNAFNGVISINTRSPFVKPGFEMSVKTGTRGLLETAMRYAFVTKNKAGVDKLGVKFNAFFLKANDWEADNKSATPQSESAADNPGGYDAVNTYGDEYYQGGDFTAVPTLRPGIGVIYRTGYQEKDIVDYNTQNIKLNTAIHYKIKNETEMIFSSNFGSGTTVYQGDNRYSLKDILFFQNRFEIRKPNKFFVRAYMTNEDAGNSYDAFFTSILLQDAVKSDADWVDDYTTYFSNGIINGTGTNIFTQLRNLPGFPKVSDYATYEEYLAAINPFLVNNYLDTLNYYHGLANNYADSEGNPFKGNSAYLQPGTAAFDSAFKSITSKQSYSEGGSMFYDKSALLHTHGEYKLNISTFETTFGANYRKYLPNSNGTIFSDTLGRKITNEEFGAYVGVDKKFYEDKFKVNYTVRLDKNQNFGYLISPAASGIYNPNKNNTFRVSFSSAIRNPTLADQYLFYRVGRATLLGNVTGYDSLVTIPSLFTSLNYSSPDSLNYFNVDPVKPEKVKTLEVGYRTTLFDHLFIDMNAYYSIYTDFIGYRIGADVNVLPNSGIPIQVDNIYRIASNSLDEVTTEGFSIGFNYYFNRFYSFNGNYSYNKLDRQGSDDPLIPAFNTPTNKFNIGIAGNDIQSKLGSNWGFNINYKWVQGFIFEGSPQFTGPIESYGIVDAQVNKRFLESKTTIKIGASNLLENKHYEVFGGPLIGRLLYLQLTVELN